MNSLRHVTLSPLSGKNDRNSSPPSPAPAAHVDSSPARYYLHHPQGSDSNSTTTTTTTRGHQTESLTYKIKHVEEDVLRNLRMVIDKHDKEELQHYVSKEWEDIAIVFDRFLFWIFFMTACTATLFLLVFKPLTKDINIETSKFYQPP